MPTYEYLCEACGLQFEKFQKMTDEAVRICPMCGGIVKRLISAGNVIFNGSGFKETDYRKSAPGRTCCGRTERCDKPPCSDDGACRR
jgi:putative FmdB family regulatory protein